MAIAHHTLVAWQRADDLFITVHQLSLKAFPAFEKHELGGQLRRAAFSVAVNIVEGFATAFASERLKTNSQIVGVVMFVLLPGTPLI